MSFSEALQDAQSLDMILIPYEDARGMRHAAQTVRQVIGKRSVGIFIGPEGGFDVEEVEAAMMEGIHPITLGRRILRTETAGMTMLSILMFQLEQ